MKKTTMNNEKRKMKNSWRGLEMPARISRQRHYSLFIIHYSLLP